MGLISEKAITTWNASNKKYLQSKGYIFTYYRDEIEVDISDLKNTSHALVEVKCDFCNKIYKNDWHIVSSYQSDLYCCPECLKTHQKKRDKDGNLIFIYTPYRDKDWLYEEYITKDREAKDIAFECNVNVRTLRDWIEKFELNNKYGFKKEKLTKDILEDLYVNKHKTSEEIGEIYDLSGNTVINIARKYRIKIPSRSELLDIYYNEKGGKEIAREKYGTMENRILASCRQRNISIDEFDGFLKDEYELARNTSEYDEFRRTVLERDNYTCQCCGKRGGNLNVHHIYNFKDYIELRTDINNGITLCEECHAIKYKGSFHSVYGQKNNTKEQLVEYIRNKNPKAIERLSFLLEEKEVI